MGGPDCDAVLLEVMKGEKDGDEDKEGEGVLLGEGPRVEEDLGDSVEDTVNVSSAGLGLTVKSTLRDA